MNAEATKYLETYKEKVAELRGCTSEHDRIWLSAMIAMLSEKLLSFGVEVSNEG